VPKKVERKLEIKEGMIINLGEDEVAVCGQHTKAIEIARSVMHDFAEKIEKEKELLWKLLNEYYPGINQYHCQLQPDKKRVLVSMKRKEE
jgi:hypothetical protein